MEKNCNRRLCFGVSPIILFLILPLLFDHFYGGNIFPLHQGMRSFSSNSVKIGETDETIEDYEEPSRIQLSSFVRGEDRKKLETTGFACNTIPNFSKVCVANKPVRIETGKNITVHVPSNQSPEEETTIKPYSRQEFPSFLEYITPVKILHGNITNPPLCQINHKIPAVIFAIGRTGVGNLFHEMSDMIIPLFLTTKHFKSQVVIIQSDYNPSFLTKYNKILSKLSRYKVMDPTKNQTVHCFPQSIIGLMYHNNLLVNSSGMPGYTYGDFRQFLRQTYDLKFNHVSQIETPTLVLMSRGKTRRILNENDLVHMMEELGFHVILATDEMASNMTKFSSIVNSCNVMVGVHGAGLTNELFLPDGGVMVQVEPLDTEFISKVFLGDPTPAMDLKYVRYKIETEESSLGELYGRDHPVIVDPGLVLAAKGHFASRAVYLGQQHVRINLVRFRDTLVEVLDMIKNSSSKGV